MKTTPAFLSSLPERLLALAFLICLLPTLLLIGCFLRSNSDEQVLLSDQVLSNGTMVRSYRFRTTGRGSRAFRGFGRFLRAYGMDELPGLRSVVRGDIRLKQMLQIRRVL